jgi:folate-dependent phosphoribosylglycinamide formyltransferase PurN
MAAQPTSRRVPVLVMTGDKLRHQYFANRILGRIPDGLLLVERQPAAPWGSHVTAPTPLIRRHFDDFHAQEIASFSATVDAARHFLRDRTFADLPGGTINDEDVIRKVVALDPGMIVVLSTSLIREPFIRAFPGRMINFHAGLSPYYRGAGTNVFPFYNRELEYVGVTIHHVDPGIDSGSILLHGRPQWEPEDNTHTIGCKNVAVAADLVLKIVEHARREGPPGGRPQDLGTGRVYYKKDFTDEVVRRIYDNIGAGMVRDYAAAGPRPVALVESLAS